MVAIPRSKGCITCRKRRVKCDEEKPLCARCLKAGFLCAGYDRGRLFRNISTAPLPQSPPRSDPPRRVSPAAFLDLKPFREEMSFAYLFENFVWRTYGTPWLEMAAHGQLDDLAQESTRALALSHFARDHAQKELQVESVTRYGCAIQQLGTALFDTDSTKRIALVIPILILLLYSSAREDRAASITHIQGLMMLLQTCGPLSFQDPVLVSALESSRATLVTIALITKQRTFLEQPRWRNGPWTAHGLPRGNQSRLMDILVVIPGLLEDLRQLGQPGITTSIDPSHIVSQASSQLKALFQWRWEWELENSGCVWSQPRETTGDTPAPFPTKLQFQFLSQVTDIMLYNAVLLWLLGMLEKLVPFVTEAFIQQVALQAQHAAGLPPDSNSDPNNNMNTPLLLPGHATTLRAAAIEICRALEYDMANIQQKRDSSLFFLLPIGMAWGILKDDPSADFKRWLRDTLSRSPVTAMYFADGYQWLWKMQTNTFQSFVR